PPPSYRVEPIDFPCGGRGDAAASQVCLYCFAVPGSGVAVASTAAKGQDDPVTAAKRRVAGRLQPRLHAIAPQGEEGLGRGEPPCEPPRRSRMAIAVAGEKDSVFQDLVLAAHTQATAKPSGAAGILGEPVGKDAHERKLHLEG